MRIRQVMRNLIRNALEALDDRKEVKVEVEWKPEEVTLSVLDRGNGIPLEALSRVGTPFFTTKPRGTGLGLATAARIAQEHRGRLEIGNREGGGAKIRLILPRNRSSC